MTELKKSSKNENYMMGDTPAPTSDIILAEKYYNCSECSSLIEIISINEDNYTIEFNCLNKDNNHPKNLVMPIKEYLEKMKKYNKKELHEDNCEIHKDKYICYCFDCNSHLCKECLKARIHLNHSKNYLIEIEPIKEELNIIKEVIQYYEIKIGNLTRGKQNKINELKNILKKNKDNEDKKYKENIKLNENEKEKELKLNEKKYNEDINEIIKRSNYEMEFRKKIHMDNTNKINDKYNSINEKITKDNENKINELNKNLEKDIKNLKYEKQIENINNLKRINELIFNTYDMYNNNYYNAININSILLSYMKNDYIKNKIMKKILKDKFDEICNIIQQKKKEDEKNNIKQEKQLKDEITNKCIELMNEKINEINEQWKNKIEELKIKYQKEIKERDKLNKKNTDELKNKILNYYKNIIEKQISDYKNSVEGKIQFLLEANVIDLNYKKDEFSKNFEELTKTSSEIKNTIEQSKIKFIDIINFSKIMEQNE